MVCSLPIYSSYICFKMEMAYTSSLLVFMITNSEMEGANMERYLRRGKEKCQFWSGGCSCLFSELRLRVCSREICATDGVGRISSIPHSQQSFP